MNVVGLYGKSPLKVKCNIDTALVTLFLFAKQTTKMILGGAQSFQLSFFQWVPKARNKNNLCINVSYSMTLLTRRLSKDSATAYAFSLNNTT